MFHHKQADTKPLIDNDAEAGEDEDDFKAENEFKQNDITLWLSDAIVLIVEHLQFYALFLSLSEKWGWPIQWVDATSFSFLFNFDIWEFRKVQTGAFNQSRAGFIETKTLGFNYASYLASWAVLLCIIGAGFFIVYIRWMRRRPLYLLLYIAHWKRVFFIVVQFLCIPFGVAAARVFYCRYDPYQKIDVMDVQNEFKCFGSLHIAFMVLVGIIFFCCFILYPSILARWVSEQVFSKDSARHEGYLQLKEAEYEQGLDTLWDTGQYHLFSSFNRSWVYYNVWKFIMKLLILAAFALSVRSTFYSSAAITTLFCLMMFAFLIQRPFRVACFNFMIIFSYLCLSANALIGNFMVRPPWEDPKTFDLVGFLRYPYILNILLFINAMWIVGLVLFLIYMASIHFGIYKNHRLWPRLSYENSNFIGEDTKKYLKAALRARYVLEASLMSLPLFAPVHELAHQIKVINAFCREAEYIKDPTHDTLWDILDELIEAHNALSPVSVFGMSGKNSVRETSQEFIKLMPSFKKRLAQREYDLILVPPMKRRMLLKMYVLGVFMNGGKHKKSNDEVGDKVKEALKTFDDSDLSLDYDTGLGSTASIQETRTTSAVTTLDGGMGASVTDFLNDLEALVSDYPHDDKPNSTREPRKSIGKVSRSSKASTFGSQEINQILASPRVSKVSLPVSPLARDNDQSLKSMDFSGIGSNESFLMKSPRDSRPNTAPLASPVVISSRPSTVQNPVSRDEYVPMIDLSRNEPQRIPSAQSLHSQSSYVPSDRLHSPRRPGSAPISEQSKSPRNTPSPRPGTAPSNAKVKGPGDVSSQQGMLILEPGFTRRGP